MKNVQATNHNDALSRAMLEWLQEMREFLYEVEALTLGFLILAFWIMTK